MKLFLSTRLALWAALGAVVGSAVLAGVAAGGTSAVARVHAGKGVLVALKKTTLGTILVDADGRTLYLFAKDRSGMSACTATCLTYWPPLTSTANPRAGTGVQQSMLRVVRQSSGRRQVTYAGHPLYTFAGDKHPGQTTGEGLTNFGAGWYALAAGGQKVAKSAPSRGGSGSGSGGSSWG